MNPELLKLLKKFEAFSRGGPAYEVVIKAAESIAKRSRCEDLFVDGYEPYNPSVHWEKIFDLNDEEDWAPILCRADRKFDSLYEECVRYCELMDIPRIGQDREKIAEFIDPWLVTFFWEEINEIDGDELSDVYDDIRFDCKDSMEMARDPYKYHGVSRRDFMARSDSSLANSDRDSLIRLASSLPKGDKSRRAILAGLKKATPPKG